MKIQLDENLNIKFFGGIYTDKEGGFSATIDKETYCSIVDQIQCLPLDSLKSEYAAPWTDSQTRYITIETKDTIIKTKVYGTFVEPVELTILMNNLMSLYKRLNLTKNETVNDSTSFHKYIKMTHPSSFPPPPPIQQP